MRVKPDGTFVCSTTSKRLSPLSTAAAALRHGNMLPRLLDEKKSNRARSIN